MCRAGQRVIIPHLSLRSLVAIYLGEGPQRIWGHDGCDGLSRVIQCQPFHRVRHCVVGQIRRGWLSVSKSERAEKWEEAFTTAPPRPTISVNCYQCRGDPAGLSEQGNGSGDAGESSTRAQRPRSLSHQSFTTDHDSLEGRPALSCSSAR
jgi:hypothetical protein